MMSSILVFCLNASHDDGLVFGVKKNGKVRFAAVEWGKCGERAQKIKPPVRISNRMLELTNHLAPSTCICLACSSHR